MLGPMLYMDGPDMLMCLESGGGGEQTNVNVVLIIRILVNMRFGFSIKKYYYILPYLAASSYLNAFE